jgi:hypothetical protein
VEDMGSKCICSWFISASMKKKGTWSAWLILSLPNVLFHVVDSGLMPHWKSSASNADMKTVVLVVLAYTAVGMKLHSARQNNYGSRNSFPGVHASPAP